jgi:hypothetical protein
MARECAEIKKAHRVTKRCPAFMIILFGDYSKVVYPIVPAKKSAI